MTDQMTQARAEATQEVASAILKAAGEAMQRHGDDPHSVVIVAAGFAMALQRIGERVDHRVPRIVHEMIGVHSR